jgi:DNA transposition AAA+ family ATPase
MNSQQQANGSMSMKKTDAYAAKFAFDAVFIKTKHHLAAQDYMTSIMDTAESPNPRIGILVGESGMGKTKLCERFCKHHGDIVTEEKTQKTVIYIKLSANAFIGDIIKAIYFQIMGIKMRVKGTNEGKQTLLEIKLKDVGTRLIIIDEAHHAMSGSNGENTVTGHYMNFLKTLLDNSGVPILLVGMPDLLNLRKVSLSKNKTFIKQFRRRSRVPHTLLLMNVKDASMNINTLASKLKELNVFCDCLSDNNIKAKLYCCSGGSFGILYELVMDAIIETRNSLAVTQDSLEKAAFDAIDHEENGFSFSPIELKTTVAALKKYVESTEEEAA